MILADYLWINIGSGSEFVAFALRGATIFAFSSSLAGARHSSINALLVSLSLEQSRHQCAHNHSHAPVCFEGVA